jgi:hypothetical protein
VTSDRWRQREALFDPRLGNHFRRRPFPNILSDDPLISGDLVSDIEGAISNEPVFDLDTSREFKELYGAIP